MMARAEVDGDVFLPNPEPDGTVSYVLICQEPPAGSIRRQGECGGRGLISFGPDLVDSYRRAATHVDKILKGANPAELPMEQPTKFDLVVNLTTARTLGLTIPQAVLIRATKVIQ